jgi:HK97 gp10 family phage protein
MAKLNVRVDGLTEARATIAALPQAFKDQAIESIDIGSRIILTEAGRRVPVRTTKLKQSLGRNVREDGLQAAVGSGDYKAKFVEFGTNDTPAQPFLYPAFRTGAKFVRSDMRNWAEKAGQQARFKTKRRQLRKAK